MGFSKDWCYHHIDLAQLVWTYKSLISVGFSICSPNSKLFKHVGSQTKNDMSFQKRYSGNNSQKTTHFGLFTPRHPLKKSRQLCVPTVVSMVKTPSCTFSSPCGVANGVNGCDTKPLLTYYGWIFSNQTESNIWANYYPYHPCMVYLPTWIPYFTIKKQPFM